MEERRMGFLISVVAKTLSLALRAIIKAVLVGRITSIIRLS